MKTLLIASSRNGWSLDVEDCLRPLKWPLFKASTLQSAKSKLSKGRFDLILLDTATLYDMVTLVRIEEDIAALRKAGRARIVVLYDDNADNGTLAIKCLKSGAIGFVSNETDRSLPTRIESALVPLRVPLRFRKARRIKKVFVAMPFREDLRYAMDYYEGILPALNYLGLEDAGLFRFTPVGGLLDQILSGISKSAIGIANVSHVPQDLICPICGDEYEDWKNPNGNVLFEAGLMAGQDKPVMLLFCTCYPSDSSNVGNPAEALPSDLKSYLRVEYSGRADLAFKIVRWFEAFGLSRYSSRKGRTRRKAKDRSRR